MFTFCTYFLSGASPCHVSYTGIFEICKIAAGFLGERGESSSNLCIVHCTDTCPVLMVHRHVFASYYCNRYEQSAKVVAGSFKNGAHACIPVSLVSLLSFAPHIPVRSRNREKIGRGEGEKAAGGSERFGANVARCKNPVRESVCERELGWERTCSPPPPPPPPPAVRPGSRNRQGRIKLERVFLQHYSFLGKGAPRIPQKHRVRSSDSSIK